MVFTELYILKHKRGMIYELAKMMLNNDEKMFGFNFPSTYFIETFKNDINDLIGYAEIIFTNLTEAQFFAKINNYSVICY